MKKVIAAFTLAGFSAGLLLLSSCNGGTPALPKPNTTVSEFDHAGCFIGKSPEGNTLQFTQTKNPDGTLKYDAVDTDSSGKESKYGGTVTINGSDETDTITSGEGVGTVYKYTLQFPNKDTIVYQLVSDSTGALKPGTTYTYTRSTTCK